MKQKIPMIKIVLGAMGASVGLMIIIMLFIFCNISSLLAFGALAFVVLFGIEKLRQFFAKKYNMRVWQFFLCIMLPALVPFGLFVAYYVYMENNHWAELEGLLECFALLSWAAGLAVVIGGTLLIVIVKKVLAIKANQKENTSKVDI